MELATISLAEVLVRFFKFFVLLFRAKAAFLLSYLLINEFLVKLIENFISMGYFQSLGLFKLISRIY